jgi:hypothetical protein
VQALQCAPGEGKRMKGFAENAVCPQCRTYTQQRIVSHGERECLNCGMRFNIRDTERIQHGKTIKPDDGWPQIWASLDDERLEGTLFDYLRLAASTPSSKPRPTGAASRS